MLSQAEVTSIANSLIPKVQYIANKIHWQCKKRVPKEDLEQEGMLALLKALTERFDPSLGIKPWTFAEHCVTGAMKDLYCKKNRTWHTCVRPVDSALAHEWYSDATNDRGAAAVRTDSQILAHELANRLTGQHLEVIQRRYWDEVPVSTIAEKMSLHPTKVCHIEAEAMTFMAHQAGHVYGGRRKKCSHRRPSRNE